MIRMLALIALVSIAGCSTGGTPYVAMTEPNNQQALVHIYRPNKISMREKKAIFLSMGSLLLLSRTMVTPRATLLQAHIRSGRHGRHRRTTTPSPSGLLLSRDEPTISD